jgi:hypothetical protein
LLLELSDEEVKLLVIVLEDQIRSYERQVEKIMKGEGNGYEFKTVQDAQSMASKYSKILLRLRGE